MRENPEKAFSIVFRRELAMVKAVCVLGPGGKPCSGEELTTVCSGTVEFEQETEEGPTKVGSEVPVYGL